MKYVFFICVCSIVLLTASCTPTPKTLAEQYMELTCANNDIREALNEAKTDKECRRLQAKEERNQKKMEQLNAKILELYQDDKEAMEIIRDVAATYQCEEK
ncbi:MAG: hypothetical protein LBU91_05940 [Bacteroidales bacterium]|jgi:predicted nucleotidyltransferase|nr:hypothetical protein [Bacteroidales bacterium]